MVFNITSSYSVRIVSIYCALTCIYLPIILLFLSYTDNLYNIGKYSFMPVLLAIILAECIKFGLNVLLNDISFGSRTVKGKKFHLKWKLKDIFKSIYVIIGSMATFYLLAVLFGAPLLSEFEETYMFAALLSVLCVFPSCLNLGPDMTISYLTGTKPTSLNDVSEVIVKNMQITLLGAWLGAIVIPLDWDRPWQMWPIPCCLGAIFGSILSHVFTFVKIMPATLKVFRGKNSK